MFAELAAPGAARTVVFYAHYDGQPVDPKAWTGTGPFEPGLRTGSIEAGGALRPFPGAGTPYQDDWRIYARSASDDKSPIVALLAAIDALAAKGIPRAVNLKIVLDSEEENGSPGLEPALAAQRRPRAGGRAHHRRRPRAPVGAPLVFYGNRGVLDFHLTVYGPVRGLHSGHYGNWAPNPAMRLAQLLASMKDAAGRVRIDGFYADVVPLTARERAAVDAMPFNDAELMRELQFGEAEGGGRKLADLINEPSLNIRGLRSAYVGDESQNVVPDRAEASCDIRLVKNIDPDRQFGRVVAHVEKQGYFVGPRPRAHGGGAAHARARGPPRLRRRLPGHPNLHGPPGVGGGGAGPRRRTRRQRREGADSWRQRPDAPVRPPRPARDRGAHRQLRQQPALAQREPARRAPLARDRNLRRAARGAEMVEAAGACMHG